MNFRREIDALRNIPFLVALVIFSFPLLVIAFVVYFLDESRQWLPATSTVDSTHFEVRLLSEILLLFALAYIATGVLLLRKVYRIIRRNMLVEQRLHESEARMKLALSGAHEGTWDLDVNSGKLNFDSQWGELLGYQGEKERPQNLQAWRSLIHGEDRDRVLGIMRSHIAGELPEYRAEYRIRNSEGELRWVLGQGKAVERDASGRALRIVGVTRDITLIKQSEHIMWKMAHLDYLTGLPNRSLLVDRLQQGIAHAQRNGRKFALLYMDLDGFKQVNDARGHEAGDELLREVATRLTGLVRADDTVSRMGGDEFVVLMNDVLQRDNVVVLAEKIISTLAMPFRIGGSECSVGSSIGIALYPDDGKEVDTLLSEADAAMYRVKRQGKNHYQFFSEMQ